MTASAIHSFIFSTTSHNVERWYDNWASHKPDMGTSQNIFDSNQLSLRRFWFDSTHDSQWLNRNWFKSAHDSKWICEIWIKSTDDSKSFKNILIQINSWLKKLSNILIQINSWLIKSGILIWIKSLLNDSNQLLISLTFLGFHWISLTFFGFSLNFVGLFWGFHQISLTYFWSFN